MAAGTDINGPAVLNFHRDCRCNPGACKCCCYQEVTVQDGAGSPLGGIIEKFWVCIPNYGVGHLQPGFEPQPDIVYICNLNGPDRPPSPTTKVKSFALHLFGKVSRPIVA